MCAKLEIGGFSILLLNGGDQYRPNRAFSYFVNFHPISEDKSQAALDHAWYELTVSGRVLSRRYYQSHYTVEDQYGVNWQLANDFPAERRSQAIVPLLMFHGQAVQALQLYSDLFPEDRFGPVFTDASGEWVDFGFSTVAGTWFMAMDVPADVIPAFNPGNSLLVNCDSQEEIDRLWDALSAVPEAERCGCLVDKLGLSWLILPTNIGELLAKPGAYEKVQKMKKIVIADL